MNVRNQSYAENRQVRDRAINYWQNQVIQNYLPPIDQKKKNEMTQLKKLSTSISQTAFKKSGRTPNRDDVDSQRGDFNMGRGSGQMSAQRKNSMVL